MRIGDYPVIYVKWLDAQSTDDWTDIDELEDDLPEIHTVGFLMKQTPEKIVLAMNYDQSNESASMTMTIRRDWCLEIKMFGDMGPILDELKN